MRAHAPSGLTQPSNARRALCQLAPRISTKAPSTISVDAASAPAPRPTAFIRMPIATPVVISADTISTRRLIKQRDKAKQHDNHERQRRVRHGDVLTARWPTPRARRSTAGRMASPNMQPNQTEGAVQDQAAPPQSAARSRCRRSASSRAGSRASKATAGEKEQHARAPDRAPGSTLHRQIEVGDQSAATIDEERQAAAGQPKRERQTEAQIKRKRRDERKRGRDENADAQFRRHRREVPVVLVEPAAEQHAGVEQRRGDHHEDGERTHDRDRGQEQPAAAREQFAQSPHHCRRSRRTARRVRMAPGCGSVWPDVATKTLTPDRPAQSRTARCRSPGTRHGSCG